MAIQAAGSPGMVRSELEIPDLFILRQIRWNSSNWVMRSLIEVPS